MAKTLDELQALLAGHGSACQQMLDAVLAKRLETPTSKNLAENERDVRLPSSLRRR